MKTVTVKGEGITVDLLLWRAYGVRGRALVEETLVLNQGLSALGPVLPLGTAVTLPDLPMQTTTDSVPVVTLFGER